MDKSKVELVTDISQIPDSFASEDDEREWWAGHEFSDEVRAQLQEGVPEANEWLARFKRGYRRTHPVRRRRAV